MGVSSCRRHRLCLRFRLLGGADMFIRIERRINAAFLVWCADKGEQI